MITLPGNLLFLISGLERGGAELRLLDFARYFPADLAFHMCVTSEQRSLLPEFQKHTGNIVFVPVKRPYLEPGKIREIAKYTSEHGIDVVNTFDLKGLLIAVCVKRLGLSRIRIFHHAVNLLHNYRLPQKALLRFLLRSVDGVVCNSHEAARVLRGYVGAARVRTIHNGIDTVRFKKNGSGSGLRKKLGIADDETVLGTVANFRPEKNYTFLLDTFGALSRTYPHLRLLCVGGGTLLDAMRKHALDCAIMDKVIFPDYIDDVREYLDAMDIFVLCSLKESLPNALIQAMSMELPVVSSRVGGCPEVVDHLVNGVLFEPNSEGDFEKLLTGLIEEREFAVKLGQQGRKKVEQTFSLEAMIGNYVTFYRTLVGAGAGRTCETPLGVACGAPPVSPVRCRS